MLALLLIAAAAEPTAQDLVKRYDQLMSPATFESEMELTAHREDGTERTYRMKFLKGNDDKVRIRFEEPASARGQEMLRVGENSWIYMPSLKRAVRLANREAFMGGDFNNADVLRVNYTADYDATLSDSTDAALFLIELKAKTSSAAYDRIRLFMSRADQQPARAEYFASSGKMLRSAIFSEVKDFRGHKRPARVLMKNELAQARWSALVVLDLNLAVKPPATKFVLDNLGR